MHLSTKLAAFLHEENLLCPSGTAHTVRYPFLDPFALRGARMALQRMTNNVKDWLPSDFPETADLEWFGQHFLGEQFIVVTWPGCTEDDERFQNFVAKLKNEVAPPAPVSGTSSTPSGPSDIVQTRPPFSRALAGPGPRSQPPDGQRAR